jgi:hypothetical protein
MRYFKPSLPPVAVLLEPPRLMAVRVASASKDPSPLVKHEEPLPHGDGSYLSSGAAPEGSVASLLTRLGEPRKISLVVGDPFFRSQVITLPEFPRKEEERQQLLLWHLRKSLNLPIDGTRLRYEVLGRNGAEVTLWLTLCGEEWVRDLESQFEKHGCEVGHVGVSSVELYNLALAKNRIPGEGACLLINRVPGYLSLLFVQGGNPLFFRSRETLLDGEEDGAHRIAQDLRLTLAYHKEKLGGQRIEKVLLRRYPEGLSLPLEEVLEEGTPVENLEEGMALLPNGQRRGAEWLPLYGLMEG